MNKISNNKIILYIKWNDIIQDYKSKHFPKLIDELNWIKEQNHLKEAIKISALAINRNHKRFNHQKRIHIKCLQKAKIKLLKIENKINNCCTPMGR